MNTQEIIADLELVRDILTLDASPARKAAAAVLLRAAADAIETTATDPDTPDGYHALTRGEIIQSGDVYRGLDGKIYPAKATGDKYDPIFDRPLFRPINH